MSAGDPLSRAIVAGMAPAEFAAREAEIDRWMHAGAVEGQAASPLVRPDGHAFTRAEIAAMTPAEFAANEPAIDAATRAATITK